MVHRTKYSTGYDEYCTVTVARVTVKNYFYFGVKPCPIAAIPAGRQSGCLAFRSLGRSLGHPVEPLAATAAAGTNPADIHFAALDSRIFPS